MSLKNILQEDMKSAMKHKHTVKKNAITMVRAAILQIEKDNKIQLNDEGIIEVISKQVKQRKDSILEFEKGNRPDLVESVQKEIDILINYLPEQLTEEELSHIVTETVSEIGAKTLKDIGKVMKALMPKIKGKADGKLVNSIVKQHLQ